MPIFRTLEHPLTVFWETTPQCNHTCVHCFNYWRSDREKALDLRGKADALRPLLLAEKIASLKPVRVVLTGGEPLLIWDDLIPCISFFKSKGIVVSLNTNAALMTDEKAELLAGNDISLLVSFPCSDPHVNDAITGVPGSFANIVKGLDILSETGVRFSCNMVVSKLNLKYIEETVTFLHQRYRIKRMSLSRVGKPVNAGKAFDKYSLEPEDIRTLISSTVFLHNKFDIAIDASAPYPVCALKTQEEYDLLSGKRICSAGKTSVVIGSDGSIKACPRDSRIYGNILSGDFMTGWEAMQEWRDGSLYPSECKACAYMDVCKAACRADGLADTGTCGALDRAVRLEKLPLTFEKKKYEIPDYSPDQRFYVARGLVFEKERTGYRVSSKGRSTFLTDAAYVFLKNHDSFTPVELSEIVKNKDESRVIAKLLNYGIIEKCRDGN